MARKFVPFAAALTLLALTGCADKTYEVSEGFFGAVAADEPRAALVAHDVLIERGNAADAAVAAYFTLAATLPSSAGLGAGGECLVFDPAGKRFERLEFPAVPASAEPGAAALPMAPRGLFALHARYGRTRFEQLLNPAEQLARFGDLVSRRLASDLERDGAALRRRGARPGPLAPAAGPLKVGDRLVQVDLAATLGRMRAAGVGDLYAGQLAQRLIEGAAAIGRHIDPAALRTTVPVWTEADGPVVDYHVWAVAASRPADRALLGQSLAVALHAGRWDAGSASSQPAQIAEIQARAAKAAAAGQIDVGSAGAERLFAGFAPGAPATDPGNAARTAFGGASTSGATSFFVTDAAGLAIGCAFSMNAPFGTGDTVPGLGFLLAPAKPASPAPLAAALLVGNRNAWQTHLSLMAAGGREAGSALVSTAAGLWLGKDGPEQAVRRPRAHLDLADGTVAVEAAVPEDGRRPLAAAGYKVRQSEGGLGAVRLFRCIDGIPRSSLQCGASDDPRGLGMLFFEKGR